MIRAVQYGLANLGAKAPANSDAEVYRLRPWYHDYSPLGVRTNFDDVISPGEQAANVIRRVLGKSVLNSGSHPHQHLRDERLIPMLQEACELYTQKFTAAPQSFLDTMGADGYYSFYAVRRLGFERAHCVDLESEHIRRGELMRRMLSLPQVTFNLQNVYDMPAEKYDVGLSSGGLYHVHDPELVLKMMRERVRVLVVLSTVSQNSDSPDYKISPAPGWRHGSAFSREWLSTAAKRTGWQIARRDGFVYKDARFDGQPEGVELLLCV